MAEARGVEPHPISRNLVFKASRRTNPAALTSKKENHSVRYHNLSGCGRVIVFGAGKEARTPDIYLGKVVLYQLSYARINLVPHDRIELP